MAQNKHKRSTDIDDFLDRIEEEKNSLFDFSHLRLTLVGKITVATLVIGVVFFLKFLFIDKNNTHNSVSAKEKNDARELILSLDSLANNSQTVDSLAVKSKIVSVMGDGDYNIAIMHINRMSGSRGEDFLMWNGRMAYHFQK